MAFISKDELESEAARLGVNLEDYGSWAEKQKAVFAAQAAEEAPKKQEKIKTEVTEEQAKNFYKVKISSEIPQLKYQAGKFDEDLGEDMEVEDLAATTDWLPGTSEGSKSGTYRIKNRTGKRVIAQSSLPTVNVQITFDPARDMFPVVEYQGKRGYLWKHHRFFGVRDVLEESGYLHKYLEQFNGSLHPDHIWYAGTKLLACSIPYVHYVMTEIEQDAARRG